MLNPDAGAQAQPDLQAGHGMSHSFEQLPSQLPALFASLPGSVAHPSRESFGQKAMTDAMGPARLGRASSPKQEPGLQHPLSGTGELLPPGLGLSEPQQQQGQQLPAAVLEAAGALQDVEMGDAPQQHVPAAAGAEAGALMPDAEMMQAPDVATVSVTNHAAAPGEAERFLPGLCEGGRKPRHIWFVYRSRCQG